MKTILLLATLSFFFLGCSKEEFDVPQESQTNGNIQRNFQGEVKSAYFENWVSAVRGGGGGTRFFFEFTEPVPDEVTLNQLYFRNQSEKINTLSQLLYVAYFTNKEINYEDGDSSDVAKGNLTTERVEPPIPIADDQALLEYFIDGEVYYLIISKVVEHEIFNFPE